MEKTYGISCHVLITGGAGFIGSHLASELMRHGYRVRVLDNLSPHIHGSEKKRPKYLDPEVQLVIGDVRDPDAVRRALKGIDAVYHLAAVAGVGQSMYQIAEYTTINHLGTAVLLEQLTQQRVQRLVVASSMSIYGEGLYRAPDGTTCTGIERTADQLKAADWQARNAAGEVLTAIPTPETKPPSLASVYSLSKYDQERMCLMVGRAYGIPTVALRFFSVYGPNQELCNSNAGVLASFASRLLNGKPPVIYEDGHQQRDFVSVYDVARGCHQALEADAAAGQVINIGSGHRYTIRAVAQRFARVLGKEDLKPEITRKYRMGDIRHCFADISLARQVLGYRPQVSLEEGLQDLAEWYELQAAQDRVAEAGEELAVRQLIA